MKVSVARRVVLSIVGAAVLAYLVRRAGTASIGQYLSDLGFGVLVPTALVGLQHALRSLSWHTALKATHNPLPYSHVLRARLGAETVGYLSLTGSLGSQTGKVWLLREGVPPRAGTASVVVDALASAIAGVLFSGTALLVSQSALGLPAWCAALGGALVTLALIAWTLAASWSGRRRRSPDPDVLISAANPPDWRAAIRDSMRRVEAGLVRLHGQPFARMIGLHLLGHAGLWGATWSILWLAGISSRPEVALFFETGAKLGNVMGAVIPARLGVFEVGVATAASVAALPPATGVAVGLVRRIVDLLWVCVGLAILVIGWNPGANARQREPTDSAGWPGS